RLHFLDAAEIFRGGKLARFDLVSNGGGFDVFDVAASLVERGDLRRVHIQTQHAHARPGELKRQRQTDVTETNNGYFHKDGLSVLGELNDSDLVFFAFLAFFAAMFLLKPPSPSPRPAPFRRLQCTNPKPRSIPHPRRASDCNPAIPAPC